ncbi:hypothetical protein [uncultured Bacteroides sp.]|uniref:hypothetical protein n=1 Tax=uncultured Bacteroides sp. TaxID=162156 RepID=UPI00262A6570|nr:hypothetical protein [uncultured Bacteroides sp.]
MTRKKSTYKKKQTTRQQWYDRVRKWGKDLLWVLAFLAVYLPGNYLAGCTLVNSLPSGIEWMVLVIFLVLYLGWAWIVGRLEDWSGFLLHLFIGGVVCYMSVLFFMTVLLGANYLIPNSEPCRRKAVVCSKRKEKHYRQMWHNYVVFRFLDNGSYFRYDTKQKVYNRLLPEDTCTVTFRDGILGYPVIQNVELKGRKKRELLPFERFLHDPGMQ